MTSPGTPWPVMVKNPISVQVRSISLPVRKRETGSPVSALLRSMTGICAFIGCLSFAPGRGVPLGRSVIVGAAIDDDGLAGDEGGVGAGEEGDGADEICRRHLAC